MNRLKELRSERKLSQGELAAAFQVTQQTISFYENGSRDIGTELLSRFADFFDCSVDYLLGKTNVRKWESETLAFNTVAVDGLDEDDIAQIKSMIEHLKKKHGK